MRVSNTIIESHSSQSLGTKKLYFHWWKLNSFTKKWTFAQKPIFKCNSGGPLTLWIRCSRKNSFYSLVNHSFHYRVYSENEVENICISQYDLRLEKKSPHVSLSSWAHYFHIVSSRGCRSHLSSHKQGLKSFQQPPPAGNKLPWALYKLPIPRTLLNKPRQQ